MCGQMGGGYGKKAKTEVGGNAKVFVPVKYNKSNEAMLLNSVHVIIEST